MRRRRGFNLIEVVVSACFFTAVSAVALMAMMSAVHIWNHTGSRDEALRSLERAWNTLRRDLSRARIGEDTFQVGPSPLRSLAEATDGDAVGMLSPVHPETGQLVCNRDGTPFMLRTVVYHLAVPPDHGSVCRGVRSAEGYEVACPHKILWRNVVDQGAVTLPGGTPESLGEHWRGLVGHHKEMIATNLLSFRCRIEGPSLKVELSASVLRDASQAVIVGTTDLSRQPFTIEHKSSVYPQN